MLLRLPALLLTVVLGFAGFAPVAAEVSTGMTGHACCRMLNTGGTTHEGCSQPARMSCCAPASERNGGSQAPPAQGPSSHQPDFTFLKGHAAHVPGLPALVAATVAAAFESARLRLPHDPLYLRNLVLLV